MADCDACMRRHSAPYPRVRWCLVGVVVGLLLALVPPRPRTGTTIVNPGRCTDIQPTPTPRPKSPYILL
jgi:hypothetical protein